MAANAFNYLFVSDFHIAMGIDPQHKITNPREDFFYDEEFYRFLQWADQYQEGGKKWELVFVGDCFDFLPVDLAWMREHSAAVNALAGTLTSTDAQRTEQTWSQFLYEVPLVRELKGELLDDFVDNSWVLIQTEDLEQLAEENRQQSRWSQHDSDERPAADADLVGEESAEETGEIEAVASEDEIIPAFDPVDYEAVHGQPAPTVTRKQFELQVAESPGQVRLPRWAEDRLKGQQPEAAMVADTPTEQGLFLEAKPPSGRVRIGRWIEELRLRRRQRRTYKQYQYDLFLKEEISVEKLLTIYRGHRRFFEALAWWVGQGHRLVIIAGNHDLEICWPAVQAKFKELLAMEYNQLLARASVGAPPASGSEADMAAYHQRIDFSRQWFYYKPGVFYAEHGSQYDNGNSSVNHLAPFWQKEDETLLNPSFGSLGNPIVASLEDAFPEWENAGTHGATLTYLIRTYPGRFLRILSRRLWQYADLIKVLLNGTHGSPREQGPSQELLERYQSLPGHEKLPPDLLDNLYYSWDQPLLLYRRLMRVAEVAMRILALPMLLVYWLVALFRVLLSPRGLLIWVVALLLAILLRPDLFGWLRTLSDNVQTVLGFLQGVLAILGSAALVFLLGMVISGFKETAVAYVRKKNDKRFQIALYGEEYVQEGGRQTARLFEERANDKGNSPEFPPEALPRYYIFGHDHIPYRILLKEGNYWTGAKSTYYFNTGSWLSLFSGEDTRRLRTGGGDLEFTFLKIWQPSVSTPDSASRGGEYEASLLRWDDEAGRAEDQLVIAPKKEKDAIAEALKGRILALAGLGATIGLIVGITIGSWGMWTILGVAIGALLGWLLHYLTAKKVKAIDDQRRH